MTTGAIFTLGIAIPASATASDAAQYGAMLNHERTSHGLRALAWRSDLTSVAYRWAAHMAATGQLAHNPGLAYQVTNWQSVGENVGEGPSIADLDAAFWASAPHRANILDPTYDSMGIGAVRRDGTIWITIVFRDTLRVASTWHPSYTPSSSRHVTATAKPQVHRVAARAHTYRAPAVRAPSPEQVVLAGARLADLVAIETDGRTHATVARRATTHPWEGAALCSAASLLTGAALRRSRIRIPDNRASDRQSALRV